LVSGVDRDVTGVEHSEPPSGRTLRIGLMLRSLDEKGGIGVYARYLTEELLELDRRNHYVLFYQNPAHLRRFARDNVTERVLLARNTAVWDQLSVPYACWRERVDVVLHPKFTVPLLAPCRTAMVLHGAGWFMQEFARFWKPWDLRYLRFMMPVYCRRADAVLAVSEITKRVFDETFGLSPDKIRTVYFGPGKRFAPVTDPGVIEDVRARYGLPDRFILTLAKYGDGGRKNIVGTLRAFASLHGTIPQKLVVLGKDAYRLGKEQGISGHCYGGDVLFTDWVDQEDLPTFYSLADLFLYPSFVEAFPIPITEALACGAPIVTSDANGMRELADGAAILVDPANPDQIAAAVKRVLSEPGLAASLSARALERSKRFRWETCARETLAILQKLGA
jgi:glycosyltransferase involved in cell wall biosynthesis